jgi:NTE family protein
VEQLVPARRFADLSVPITVTTVDLDTGELVLFGEGGEDAPLIDVLCASCALPLYFPAATVAGRRCGDGGLRGPLPLDIAARLAQETVVAVDVGPGFDEVPASAERRLPPVVQAHDEAAGMLMAHATALQLALWRAEATRPSLVYVRPRVERNATFRVDRVRGYAEDGYRATRDALLAMRRA